MSWCSTHLTSLLEVLVNCSACPTCNHRHANYQSDPGCCPWHACFSQIICACSTQRRMLSPSGRLHAGWSYEPALPFVSTNDQFVNSVGPCASFRESCLGKPAAHHDKFVLHVLAAYSILYMWHAGACCRQQVQGSWQVGSLDAGAKFLTAQGSLVA